MRISIVTSDINSWYTEGYQSQNLVHTKVRDLVHITYSCLTLQVILVPDKHCQPSCAIISLYHWLPWLFLQSLRYPFCYLFIRYHHLLISRLLNTYIPPVLSQYHSNLITIQEPVSKSCALEIKKMHVIHLYAFCSSYA